MPHDDRFPDTAIATERVDRDMLIPASPDEVWAVITGDGWLADRVELDLVPGGDARFSDPDCVRTGWVEEARIPGSDEGVLVFWWGPDGEPAARVALTLVPEGERLTRLRVAESRPLETLDLVGTPLPGRDGAGYGPAMLAVA